MQIKIQVIVLLFALFICPKAMVGQIPDLGAASTFALFTASGAFNGDPGTNVIGDIGTNAGAFTPPGIIIGQVHVADVVSIQAATDVAIAYGYLSSLTCGGVLSVTLGNAQQLTPNIYCTGAASTLNGSLVLDGQGDPNAVFIFQIDGAFSTTVNSTVTLINGANLCNVFWQINGAVELGVNSFFQGIIVAEGAINLDNGANLNGKGLSTAGAISTSANTVTSNPCCSVTLPTITCPAPLTVSCANTVPAPDIAAVTTTGAAPITVIFAGDAISSQTCANKYTIIRSYQATDMCGNSVSCNQTITVNDQTAPVISCPTVPGTVECPAAPVFPQATATDLCGASPNISFSDVMTPGGLCPQEFSITRSWTAVDACGNTATCSRTITVTDNTVPTITCPAVITPVNCSTLVFPDANASDLCDASPLINFADLVMPGASCTAGNSITRTWTASDDCGNTATCSRTITVIDNTPPNVTCPVNITVSCAGNVPPATPATLITSDQCGGLVSVVLLSDIISNQICVNRFTISRSYQASDPCGNSAVCVQTISVNDIAPPLITCPLNVTVSCAVNVPAPNPGAINSSDFCGAVTVGLLSDVPTNQTCPNRFTLLRTYQSSDACGNTATCLQNITVNDQTAPVITCLANVTVSCADLVPAPAIASVISTDLCGGAVTVVLVGDVISNQLCSNRYTITRSYRATDLCGNSATCIQLITVLDNTPPVFTNVPPNVTVDCLLVPAAVAPLANDNCAGPVTVSLLSEIQTPGNCPITYIITRVWVASDACGNSATLSQLVTVTDNQAPQFTIFPANVMLECNTATNMDEYQAWLDSHGAASVFDCSLITWTTENSPFSLDTAGCAASFQRYIRFIATDACGNSAFRDAIFTVSDQTPPTFTTLPLNLEVACVKGDNGEAQLSDWLDHFGFAEVSDACGAVSTSIALLSEIPGCGNTFARKYQFRATDQCGNTAYLNATFSVIDTTPPVILKCPAGNVFMICEFHVPAPAMASLLAEDECGSYTVKVDTFSTGVGCLYWPKTVSYTYIVSDECGNSSSCNQSFQVVDSIPPIYSGPDTMLVSCAADLPGSEDALQLLQPYMLDNCYDIICFADSMTLTGPDWITYCVKAKDLCGNWTTKFLITFKAAGLCNPICSAPQGIWGDEGGNIKGMATKQLIPLLISKYGNLTAGKLGKTISASSVSCVQTMLPGNGNTAQLDPGNQIFSLANNCQPSSLLLNSDGSLQNILAANVMAMQLNIWFNQEFNNRNLGFQNLATLPACLVDQHLLSKVNPAFPTVQGLLDLSNNYLAGIGSFPGGDGNLLNQALEHLNNYWSNCQINNPCAGTATVAGTLKTETQEAFQGLMQLDASGNGTTVESAFAQSDLNGSFKFTDAVPIFGQYTLTPNSDGMSYMNGVTTYDLVLISKHIMGIEPLGSPYKMIAADANRSGSITTFDIVSLRKLILGISDVLPNNTAWRFVDKSYEFPSPYNPFYGDFPEHKTVGGIETSQLNNDFISIKVGDVNNSALPGLLSASANRSEGNVYFEIQDRQVQSGDIFEVTLQADQALQGFQFTLNFSGLDILTASGKDLKDDNFAIRSAANALTCSWNLPEGIQAVPEYITLRLQARESGSLRDMIQIGSNITKAEAYQTTVNNIRPSDINLRFSDAAGTDSTGPGFELHQNEPNPFANETIIGFQLPDASRATLTVYDETGKRVYTETGDFSKGRHTFTLDARTISLPASGLMYYKVETAQEVLTRKMIRTK